MIKDKLLVGVTEIDESVFSKEEIESFSNGLHNNWGIRSDLRLNNKNNERLLLPKLNVKINKLVS
jgi:hypothetical protein